MSGTVTGIGLPFREAIDYFAQKANVPTQRWTDVWRAGHARGFMVAGAASDALLQDFRREVAKGIAGEISLGQFRNEFHRIVQRHGWEHNLEPGPRARIIFETNIAMAQSAGEYARLTDPDTLAVFPYWQYVRSDSRRPRQQHLAWAGKILRADDPWWRTHFPPNGWNCRCRVRPVSGRDLQRMGRSGPDPSPPIVTRPWRNPTTGQVEHVPVGIDPGFDYNPGAAWLGGRPQVPAQIRWAEALPPPPPAPPLRPARTALPAPDVEAAERAALIDQLGAGGGRKSELRRARTMSLPGLRRLVEGPAAAERRILGQRYQAWFDQREAAGFRPDGSRRRVGALGEDVMRALAERAAAPATSAIDITAGQLRHLTRDAKAQAGRSISMEDLRRLPDLVANPGAVLRERATGNIVLVFTPTDPAEARLGKLVVHLAFRAGAEQFNAVKSGGLVPAHLLREGARYERLAGDV